LSFANADTIGRLETLEREVRAMKQDGSVNASGTILHQHQITVSKQAFLDFLEDSRSSSCLREQNSEASPMGNDIGI
jgi:hypothetical protein